MYASEARKQTAHNIKNYDILDLIIELDNIIKEKTNIGEYETVISIKGKNILVSKSLELYYGGIGFKTSNSEVYFFKVSWK